MDTIVTVGTLSERFNVSTQTVRTWCDEFRDWLSPTATPPAGEVRTFTEDDLAVLGLVAQMRAAHSPYEDIKEALAGGERARVATEGQGSKSPPDASTTALALRYEAQIAFRDGQLSQLAEERDSLREALESTRSRLEEAQERAVRAETRLEVYESTPTPEPPLEASGAVEEDPNGAPGRSWWQVWKR